jgi:hypothetical protein
MKDKCKNDGNIIDNNFCYKINNKFLKIKRYDDGIKCVNNYECSSNFCFLDDECRNYDEFLKIVKKKQSEKNSEQSINDYNRIVKFFSDNKLSDTFDSNNDLKKNLNSEIKKEWEYLEGIIVNYCYPTKNSFSCKNNNWTKEQSEKIQNILIKHEKFENENLKKKNNKEYVEMINILKNKNYYDLHDFDGIAHNESLVKKVENFLDNNCIVKDKIIDGLKSLIFICKGNKNNREKKEIEKILFNYINNPVKESYVIKVARCRTAISKKKLSSLKCKEYVGNKNYEKLVEKINKLNTPIINKCISSKTYYDFEKKNCDFVDNKKVIKHGIKMKKRCIKSKNIENFEKLNCHLVKKDSEIITYLNKLREKKNKKGSNIKLFLIIGIFLLLIFIFLYFFIIKKRIKK